jgi:ubiquinone/menaquinone biosynthesis C-methylase UbiE
MVKESWTSGSSDTHNKLELDYSEVIDALDYTQGLAEHPDIPQADAGIFRIISEKGRGHERGQFRVLDLGCGPGRLTPGIAEALTNVRESEVIGLDISSGFIKFAREHKAHDRVSYQETDFLTQDFGEQKFNVIVMQGLVHHVPKDKREAWLRKCTELLAENGAIIIGDEFVPEYSSEEERVVNVVGLYAYVIASALRAHHQSLADIEAKNMVDDVSSGLPGAGHSDAELLGYIQEQSQKIYETILLEGSQSQNFKTRLSTVAEHIQRRSAEIAQTSTESHDRGDYKISVERQTREMEGLGLKTVGVKKYGPTDWLGGMAVLTFEKK